MRTRTRLALTLLASSVVLLSTGIPAQAAPSPTELVADIVPGSGSSTPSELTVFNGRIYFVAADSGGDELFVSDGSLGSATNLNLNPSGASDASELVVIGNTLYFSATDGVHGTELWSVTGSGAPTMVADIETGAGDSDPTEFTLYNGDIYFRAYTSTTGQVVFRLSGGVVSPYPTSSTLSAPSNFFAYNGLLYFAASGPDGSQLYRLDGTNPPVQFAVTNSSGSANPKNFAVAGGVLYFLANDAADGLAFNYELYATDGVSAPTKLTTDLVENIGYQYFTVFNDTLFYAGGTAATGREIGRTTGGAIPSYIDVNPGAASSFAEGFTPYNGILYFGADNGVNGYELMSLTGGTPVLRADINVGAGDSFASVFIVANGKLLFSAYGDGNNAQLWSFDGAIANQESAIVATDADVYEKVVLGDYVYFKATSTANGNELWRTRIDAAAVTVAPALAATGTSTLFPAGIAAALLLTGVALTLMRRRTPTTQQ